VVSRGSRRGSRFGCDVTPTAGSTKLRPNIAKPSACGEESGRGETADVAAVLGGVAVLYVADERYAEARRTLDRGIAILSSAKGVVATDWIKLFSTRAELHVRQGEWHEAEADMAAAISAAGRDTRLDPAVLKPLRGSYAHVLRKKIIAGGRLAPSRRAQPLFRQVN